MHERYSILKKQVEKIWTICQLSLNYNFQMMKLSYCLYHKMAAECTMSNEPLSGSTASCTWCQGLKHRTPLLKQNHVVAVGPGLSYVSQTISLIHKAWVISLNLFHDYFCSARSSDPLPGLLLLWGAGRHGGVAVSGSSHPPPHTRAKPQLRLEGDAPARMTSVWSKLHRTLILLSSRGQQRPPQYWNLFSVSLSTQLLGQQWRVKRLPSWRWEAEAPAGERPADWMHPPEATLRFHCIIVFPGRMRVSGCSLRCVGERSLKSSRSFQSQKMLWNKHVS